MYVDKLDLLKVKFGKDGPPCPVKFTVAAWNKEQVLAVLTNDRNPDMSYGKLHAVSLAFTDDIRVFSSSFSAYLSDMFFFFAWKIDTHFQSLRLLCSIRTNYLMSRTWTGANSSPTSFMMPLPRNYTTKDVVFTWWQVYSLTIFIFVFCLCHCIFLYFTLTHISLS